MPSLAERERPFFVLLLLRPDAFDAVEGKL
jgi:hypothetical protein